MEFLVRIDVKWPADGDPERKARIVAEEAARSAELAAAGVLRRLWRIPGRWANYGLWEARDATELHAALSSLPFFPWLEIDVRPLGSSQAIATRIKADAGERELLPRPAQGRVAVASDPHDPLYRLVQAEDVDRRRNAVRRTGDAVFLNLGLFRIADHKNRSICSPPYGKDRISADLQCPAEIEDDNIGVAAAEQVEEMRLRPFLAVALVRLDLRCPGYR